MEWVIFYFGMGERRCGLRIFCFFVVFFKVFEALYGVIVYV